MKRSRSLPFTVSLVPTFLIAVFLTFAGVVELMNLLFHALGAKAYSKPHLLLMGVVAAMVLWSCIMAFKMQRVGISGLCAVTTLLVTIALFAGLGGLPAAGLTALPVIVAFAFKDFERME